jgi:CRP-like cAMP-binding protein
MHPLRPREQRHRLRRETRRLPRLAETDVASALAARTLHEEVRRGQALIETYRTKPQGTDLITERDILGMLGAAVNRASSRIHAEAARELDRVLEVARVKRYDDGDVVAREGEHVDELSLICNQPRAATVTSNGRSLLLVIPRRDFLGILRNDRQLAVKLLWQFFLCCLRPARVHERTARRGACSARRRNVSRRRPVSRVPPYEYACLSGRRNATRSGHDRSGRYGAGGTFWFTRKKLSGSYRRLILARRS